MEIIEKHASFGGSQEVYCHQSTALNCSMKFSIYLPPHDKDERLPVLYWLSGLTCNEQNFITKAGAQKYAAEHKVIIVATLTGIARAAVETFSQEIRERKRIFSHGNGDLVRHDQQVLQV
ncbi:alpha/beta hydrolase-fold protein, partial [Acinetobacter baumannii]|uniref:alpha/beta hydrolase n=1 Tax=Acinetobacter baumannii TaxID=470 RepID=UPI00396F4129